MSDRSKECDDAGELEGLGCHLNWLLEVLEAGREREEHKVAARGDSGERRCRLGRATSGEVEKQEKERRRLQAARKACRGREQTCVRVD